MQAVPSSPAPGQAHASLVKTENAHQVIVRDFGNLRFDIADHAASNGVSNNDLRALIKLLSRAEERVWRETGRVECSLLVKDLGKVLGSPSRSTINATRGRLHRLGYLCDKPEKKKGSTKRPILFRVKLPGQDVFLPNENAAKNLVESRDTSSTDLSPDVIGGFAADSFWWGGNAANFLATRDLNPAEILKSALSTARFQANSALPTARFHQAGNPAAEDSALPTARYPDDDPTKRAADSALPSFSPAKMAEARCEERAISGTNVASSASSSSSKAEEEGGSEKTADRIAVDDLLRKAGIGQPTRGRLASLSTTTPELIRAAEIECDGKGVGLLISCIREPHRITEPSWRRARAVVAQAQSIDDPAHASNVAVISSIEEGRLLSIVREIASSEEIGRHPKWAELGPRWKEYRKLPDLAKLLASRVRELEQGVTRG